ncbi:MAG TPA: hypothetical protein PKD78_08780, partial [Saprospiraceae bacterium]|nr:hypothetical protein [Saprospiraceae bacterium]
MKPLLLACSALLFPILLIAQAPPIASGWGSTGLFLNNNQDERTQYVLPTSDGSFLLVGTSVLGSTSSIWVAKVSSGGSLQANVRYSLTSLFMLQTATAVEVDGGYVIVARLGGPGSDHNTRFLVNKSTLQVVAGAQITTQGEGSTCVAKTTTGLVIMGSPGRSDRNRAARVEVLDPADLSVVGAVQWDAFFGGGPVLWGEGLQTILPTPDGGFYLIGEDTRDAGGLLGEAGCDTPTGTATSDVWVCKVNAELQVVWSRSYGGLTEDRVLEAALRNNGNIVLMGRTPCGTTTSGPLLVGPGNWLLEISPQGDALYAQSLNAFQNANGTVTGFGLLKDCPDGLLLSGQRDIASGTTGTAAYLAKVRMNATGLAASYAAGSGTWKREFLPVLNGQRHFIAEDIQQLADGRFVAWGSASPSIPPAAYVGNFWAVLLSAESAPVCAANPTAGAAAVSCGTVRNGETTTGLSTSNGQYGNYLGVPGLPAFAYAGPEKAYKITIPASAGRSNLKVTMDIVTTNIGLDMFLFGSNPQAGCLAGSVENNISGVSTRKEIIEKMLDPGDYFIVVDGRQSTDKGVFNIKFECGPCAPCACAEAEGDLPAGLKLLSEDFEQYNLANLDPQNIRWSTGTNLSTYPQVVQLAGESKTAQIKGINRPLHYDFAGLPDNRYRLSWQLFVAEGKTAAFDVFGNNDSALPGFLDFRFRADGMAELAQTDDFKLFPYRKGAWNQITLMLDMAQDSAEIWLNGDLISRT